MILTHLNKGVWLISSFESTYYKQPNFNLEDFKVSLAKEVNGYKKRRLIAFTTIYQKDAKEALKEMGFDEVAVFHSAHGNSEEYLTFLTKFSKDIPKEDLEFHAFPPNCSITMNEIESAGYNHKCFFVIKGKGEKIPKNFERMGKSNIYVKFVGEVKNKNPKYFKL
jgi:hypothetical protein